MNNKFLLPHRYKTVGWCLLVPATLLGLALIVGEFDILRVEATVFALFHEELLGPDNSFSLMRTNITPTLAGVLFLVGALLVSFSREKVEDEFIARLRQSSLLWAVLVNYSLLLLAFVFVYGVAFLSVMLYNMFTVLIIFIIRFNYLLYRSAKEMPHEKYPQSAASY